MNTKKSLFVNIVVLCLLMVAQSGCSDTNGVRESDKTIVWPYAQECVLRELKSPSSAKFPHYQFLEDVRLINYDNVSGIANYEVCSYCDAQNSFGAMTRTYFHLYVRLQKEIPSLTSTIEFSDSRFSFKNPEYTVK